ncbi:MAG: D-alanyl-D-alanine carboxypeptidase [Chitinophagaceae bacterium]
MHHRQSCLFTSYFTFSFLIFCSLFLIILSSCSIQKQISKSARLVLEDSSLQTAHVGISIYDPESGKYWYNYNGEKYFVPASNTKLPTCYAAMKYLGDSLVGLRYGIPEEKGYKDKVVVIQASGDPTFLHPDYKKQPVFDFLKHKIIDERKEPSFMDTAWKEERWGSGWGWSDFDQSYMAERSPFPIYGNTIKISLEDIQNRNVSDSDFPGMNKLRLFKTGIPYFDSIVNEGRIQSFSRGTFKDSTVYWSLKRDISRNAFEAERSSTPFSSINMPFVAHGSYTTLEIIQELFKKKLSYSVPTGKKNQFDYECPDCEISYFHINEWHKIHSQPTDSLLKPMMHRSDNFFAEQSLLMVSNEKLGIMNDDQVIDTLLKTDLKDLPQKPRWADGSGLSRYNLFSPQDFVFILNKMKNEFGMDRIKVILPTGGEGTLSNYYIANKDRFFAKTGTLSGVVALSGFLYTKGNKLLIFSVLVNNHRSSATAVRRAVEKFLQNVCNK